MIKGDQHSASVLMRDVNITDYQGSEDTAVVELYQGHLFMCKNCTVQNTSASVIESTNSSLFNEYGSYNLSESYLNGTTQANYFSSYESAKGVIVLD